MRGKEKKVITVSTKRVKQRGAPIYDRYLDTFLQAANSGSFLKASQRLLISADAVTKQVNLLEERLGVTLFHRGSQGLALTEAGKLIYFDTAAFADPS